jgi:hypothetical protein
MAAAAAPPMGGGDIIGDAIGGNLDELAAEAGGLTDDTGGDEAPLGDEGDSGITNASEETAPEEAAAPADGDAPQADAPADGTYPLTADGSGYAVPKQDFDILEGQRQYAEAVQNRFPTAADAEVAYTEATDFRSMLTDYTSGDPANIDSVLSHWAGAGETDPLMVRQFQQSFATMATRMPDTLKQINPTAYQQLSNRFINEAGLDIYAPIAQQTQSLYEKAAQTGDPTDLYNAQKWDHDHTGQYKTELPKDDPEAARLQQIEARQQELDNHEKTLVGRDWTNFNNSTVSGPKWAQYNGEIDRALDPIKANYSEPVFNAIKASVNQRLIAKLQDPSNSEMANWARNHDLAYKGLEQAFKTAWKSGQPVSQLQQRIQFFQNDFMTQARKYLPSVVKEVVGNPSPKTPGTRTATPPQQQPRTAPAAARPAQTPPAARPNGQPRPAATAPGRPAGWDAAFR